VESKWGEMQLVPYSVHSQPIATKTPTYANIATRHMPTDKLQSTDVTMDTVRPLSRSQSNVEFLVSNYDQDDQRSSIMARPSSSDSLVALSSGLTVDFSTELRLTNYKDSSADNSTAAAPSKKSKDSEFISMKTDKGFDSAMSSSNSEVKMSLSTTSLSVKNTNAETVAQHNGWIPQSKGDKQAVKEEKKTSKTAAAVSYSTLECRH